MIIKFDRMIVLMVILTIIFTLVDATLHSPTLKPTKNVASFSTLKPIINPTCKRIKIPTLMLTTYSTMVPLVSSSATEDLTTNPTSSSPACSPTIMPLSSSSSPTIMIIPTIEPLFIPTITQSYYQIVKPSLNPTIV